MYHDRPATRLASLNELPESGKISDVVLNPLGADPNGNGFVYATQKEKQAALVPRFGSFDEHWKWAGTEAAEQGRADFVKLMAVKGLDCTWTIMDVRTKYRITSDKGRWDGQKFR